MHKSAGREDHRDVSNKISDFCLAFILDADALLGHRTRVTQQAHEPLLGISWKPIAEPKGPQRITLQFISRHFNFNSNPVLHVGEPIPSM